MLLLLCCLLLVSSAPLSSDSGSWSASSSDSDEDLQLPAVFPVGVASPQTPPAVAEAPPGVIIEVEDTKTNITLSFAIFIITEEEEGSGTDGRGRSDNNSQSDDISDDVSSEEITRQGIRPMASILSTKLETSSQPMSEESTDHMMSSRDKHLSLEEMMSDQPTFTFSDFNNSSPAADTWTQTQTLPDESQETNDQPVRTSSVSSHHIITTADESVLSLSGDFSHSSSSGVTQLNPALQDITLHSNNQSHHNQQGALGVDPVDRPVLDPEPQVMSSSSEKMSSVIQDRISSGRGSTTTDLWLGSRLQEASHSIQEVVDPLSGSRRLMGVKGGHHEMLGSTPLAAGHMHFLLNSDESDESSEFVSTDPKNQTGVGSDPDSNQSLESSPTTRLITDVTRPHPDREEVQHTSVESTPVRHGVGSNPVGPDQDEAPSVLSVLRETVDGGRSRSVSQVDISSSSEESHESVGTEQLVGSATPALRPVSRAGNPQVSSSSEGDRLGLESSPSPLLVPSPLPPPQTATESGGFRSESDESDSSGSGSESDSPGDDSGNNSQGTGLHPNPISNSDSHPSPESTFNPSLRMNFSSSSEIGQKESEESPAFKVPTDAHSDVSKEASSTSIASSSGASMDAKPDGKVKDAEADSSTEAPTDCWLDVSSGTRSGSAEEEDGAITEASTRSAVSTKPTATTESSTNPPGSGASTDAIASVGKKQAGADVSIDANPDANSQGPNQIPGSEENVASPLPLPLPPCPRRKRPYRFGFLGPISHFYSNQHFAKETVSSSHTIARETRRQTTRRRHLETLQQYRHHPLQDLRNSRHTGRKQSRVSAAANPAKSSSEETNR